MIAPVLQNNLLLLSQVTALMAYSQESHTIGSILNSIMTLQWARLTSLNDSGKAFDNDCKPPLKPDPSPKQPPCNNPESLQEPPCQGKPHQRIPMKSVIFLARYGTIAPNVLSTVSVSLITLPPCTPMLLIISNFTKSITGISRHSVLLFASTLNLPLKLPPQSSCAPVAISQLLVTSQLLLLPANLKPT